MSGDGFNRITEADWHRKTGNLQNAFSTTVSYLRASHQGPTALQGEELIPVEEHDSEIDQFMRSEINKYNKLKK